MAFAVGDVIFNLYASVWHRDPPDSVRGRRLLSRGVPFSAPGSTVVLRVRRSIASRIVDAALLHVAFGICQWVFVMQPLVDGSSDWVATSLRFRIRRWTYSSSRRSSFSR